MMFIQSKNGEKCIIAKNDTMETFDFPTQYTPDENSAMQLCERYCSNEENCWGCSKSCQPSCQWIAISNCNETVETNSLSNGSITQKPGIEAKV